jgi:hypothetical protein
MTTTTLRNFDGKVSDNYDVMGVCISINYAQKSSTQFYNYYVLVLAKFAIYVKHLNKSRRRKFFDRALCYQYCCFREET